MLKFCIIPMFLSLFFLINRRRFLYATPKRLNVLKIDPVINTGIFIFMTMFAKKLFKTKIKHIKTLIWVYFTIL